LSFNVCDASAIGTELHQVVENLDVLALEQPRSVSAESKILATDVEGCIDTKLLCDYNLVSETDDKAVYGHLDGRHETDLDHLLLMAVNFEKDNVVRILLDMGANPDAVQTNGHPALIVAAGNGCTGICELLLKSHADIEIQDRFNATGLMRAAEKGQTEVVKLFLRYGANTGAVNQYGVTALELAKRKKYTETVRVLKHTRSKGRKYTS
jgi:ankyrin repeat protein